MPSITQDDVLNEFPWAIHSEYLIGDAVPINVSVFCHGQRVTDVVAYRTGNKGWVISLLPNGDGGNVLWPQHGHVYAKEIY